MFNAEKLLGKVIHEITGSSGKKKKHKSSMLGGLTSGPGLMTLIGLGVGAFEILKDKQKQPAAAGYAPQQYNQPPPGQSQYNQPPPNQPPPGQSPQQPNWGGSARPTPPPLPPQFSPQVAAPQVPVAEISPARTEELALRMIQVMIAAAHADTSLDAEEEQAILERAGKAGLSQEERMFLLDELHKPKTIAELTAGVDDPSVAKTMYMLAVSTIAVDTEAERLWLDQLATGLGLSKAVQNFIEEQG